MGKIRSLRYFIVQGTSMTPLLRTGMLVQVVPQPHLELGDIVVFSRKGLFGHRIISIRKKKPLFQVKGDTLHGVDGWFKQNQFIGVVSGVGYEGVMYSLRSPASRIMQRGIVFLSKRNMFRFSVISNAVFIFYWNVLKGEVFLKRLA